MAANSRRAGSMPTDDLENVSEDLDSASSQDLGGHGDHFDGLEDGDQDMAELEVEVEESDHDTVVREAWELSRMFHRRPGSPRLGSDGPVTIHQNGATRYVMIGERLNFIVRRGAQRRRTPPDPDRFPKVPSDKGRELMDSGLFGSTDPVHAYRLPSSPVAQKKPLARRILDRESGTSTYAGRQLNQKLMLQVMLPSTTAEMIVHHEQPCYSGQFSEDGNFFYAVNKDFKVRMYDTSNPWDWRYYKTVEYPGGQWTLTDASLSPDNKYLAYTSINSVVCLAPTDPNDHGDPYNLDLSDLALNRRGNNGASYGRFGIWSIRFSGDGRQLVAGTVKGKIVVYDVESRRTLHRISGHKDDVNAVCFADSTSPHILFSGSDDTTVKVWDTRSLGDSREAGVFVGHIEGVTYMDTKGDGRYVLSNAKDQSMKLWDLRMLMSASDFGNIVPDRRRLETRFDYRWGDFDEDTWYQDPNDNSVVTFRGHRVLRTLIRCHFSPPGSTNSRYVYSGSADGKVYIWNMDATIAGVVDVYAATKNSRPVFLHFDLLGGWGEDEDEPIPQQWRTCVRDASWHPNAPMIAASSLNGYGSSSGTLTTHSWNDSAVDDEAEPKMGRTLNKKLEDDPSLYLDLSKCVGAAREQRV